jgi:hypothetical protein
MVMVRRLIIKKMNYTHTYTHTSTIARAHTPEGIAWCVATVESASDAGRGEGDRANSRDRGGA